MRESKLGDGRDVFDHVVAEEHSLGHESTRMAGDNRDRLGRVDEVAGDVVVAAGRKRVDEMRLGKVLGLLQHVVLAVNLVDLQAGVRLGADDLYSGEEIVRTTTATQTRP